MKESFPPAKCPQCGQQIHIIDPLTISVIADRLLLRGQREINEGDFTLSIICSAMAVECALTQVFLKWKGLDIFRSTGRQPTETEQDNHERDYKEGTRPGGFAKSADFVAAFLTGKKYDEFVTDFVAAKKGDTETLIKGIVENGFPRYESQAKVDYIHQNLFAKRNRIMHWGQVDYDRDSASNALIAACAAISVLKIMDRMKYEAMEQEWRSSAQA